MYEVFVLSAIDSSISINTQSSYFPVDSCAKGCAVIDWLGHQVECVQKTFDDVIFGIDAIFSDMSQIQKVAKIVSGIFLMLQVSCANLDMTIIQPLSYQIGKFVKWINAVQIFAGIDEFIKLGMGEGPLAGQSALKIASRVAIRVGNLFETFDWLAMIGVESLASVSALFGGTEILGAVGQWTFGQLAKPFMLIGSVGTILDTAASKLSKNILDVKAWLTIIGEAGKVLLIVLAPTYVMTVGFAAIVLVQNGVKLAKYLIDQYEARARANNEIESPDGEREPVVVELSQENLGEGSQISARQTA